MARKEENKKPKKKFKDVIDLNPDTEDDVKVQVEALDRIQRIQRSISMRKNKAKVRRGREINKLKMATPERLKNRAQRTAVRNVRKQLSKKAYSSMSPAEKMVVDKRVLTRKTAVTRAARKLIPQMRQNEKERRSSRSEGVNEAFENLLSEKKEYKPNPAPSKRFHQLLKKDGGVKHDNRFRFVKKAPEVKEENINEVSMGFVKGVKVKIPGIPRDVMDKINSALDTPYQKRAIGNLWKLNTSKDGKATLGHYARAVSNTFDEFNARELVRVYRDVFKEEADINEEFEELVEKTPAPLV